MNFCTVRLDVGKLEGRLDLSFSYVNKAGLPQFGAQSGGAWIARQFDRNSVRKIGCVRFPAADHLRRFGDETQLATCSQNSAALAERLRTVGDVVDDIDGKNKIKVIGGYAHALRSGAE